MVLIEEILQLPKDEQLAIMHAIQDNLDNVDEEGDEVSDEIIAFMEERIKANETTHQKTYTWDQVEEKLKNRRNTR